MIGGMLQRVFGSPNDRFIKSLHSTVDAINAAEVQLESLDDAALRERTDWLRQRLADGESQEPSSTTFGWVLSGMRMSSTQNGSDGAPW